MSTHKKSTPQSYDGCGCDDKNVKSVVGGNYKKSAAIFGRVYSVIGAIIGIIIAIICIFLGFSNLYDPHTSIVMATITKIINCTKKKNTCTVDVTYMIAKKQYNAKNLSISQTSPIQKGATVPFYYNPADPSSIISEKPLRNMGWGLIGFGILLGGITTGVAVMTFKSENFAAGYGTVQGVSMITNLI